MMLLYKICPATEWEEAETAGIFAGSAIDHADGFIHLSGAHQVRETARWHFAGRAGLALIAFPQEGLKGLKWEPALFPHVYGTIPVSVARGVWPLPLKAGAHVFPDGIPR